MKVGIDLGGSHIAVGIIDNDKIVYKIEQDKLNNDEDIAHIIISLIKKALINSSIDIEKIEKIGVSIPGTIQNGIVLKAGNLNLKNYNLLEKIQNEFKSIQIQIRNDCRCAAIAEKKYGAMKEYSDCIFLNIGTGIGGAIYLKGELLEPRRYSGFEMGHMVIEKEGKQCTCGKNGCFETYCSINGLKKTVKDRMNLQNKITGKELLQILKENQEMMEPEIVTYIEDLSTGIGNLIDIFEPEVICIGGSFVYYEELFLQRLIKKLKNKTFNEVELPNIVMAELINDAGILGAVQ